ncbi:hypothetical protein MHO82_22525 [Vibrio sp. Of7-15]|uniref:hypothetical protein n=1 Tax=Vibrio sp. Of7-15 TaxID=2724879 RepID=UPI001EF1FE4A|nr:hypothetical protein [Vibrio sp. Of7-15]MCG7499644.1 hypothetical protein [Vibrio sp. Of7-15]
MSLEQRILANVCDIEADSENQFLSRFPVSHYLSFFSGARNTSPYTQFPGFLAPWFEKIVQTEGAEALYTMHRLALLMLMQRSLATLNKHNASSSAIAPTTKMAITDWFSDICQYIESGGTMYLDAHHDYFKKDIHIAALKMLPTSSICHLEVSGLPRRFLLCGGISQACYGLKTLYLDLRGNYKRLFELHMDDRRIQPHFLEEGWIRLYKEVAKEVLCQPNISGVFAQSWFWDKAVGDISKNTQYLRSIPEQGGAKFFKLSESDADKSAALNNKKRKRLYVEGQYKPTGYLMIWPRKALLEWYRQF